MHDYGNGMLPVVHSNKIYNLNEADAKPNVSTYFGNVMCRCQIHSARGVI